MSVDEVLHDFRKRVDACIKEAEQAIKVDLPDGAKPAYIREMSLARTRLQEAKMWLGKCLEVCGSKLPKEYIDEVK